MPPQWRISNQIMDLPHMPAFTAQGPHTCADIRLGLDNLTVHSANSEIAARPGSPWSLKYMMEH
jgi:hypothetical protein